MHSEGLDLHSGNLKDIELTGHHLISLRPHYVPPKSCKVYVVEESPFSEVKCTIYGSLLKILAARYDVTAIRGQGFMVEFCNVYFIVDAVHLKT